MTYIPEEDSTPTPGSPPELASASRSSKSSSLRSSTHSDSSDGIGLDASHFEEIGLEDELTSLDFIHQEPTFKPYTASYIHELRTKVKRPPPRQLHSMSAMQRDLTSTKVRPLHVATRGHARQATRDIAPGGLQPGALNPYFKRGVSSPTLPQFAMQRRNRSASPGQPIPTSPGIVPGQRLRRGSWQSNTQRKTIKELELECDEDDGDDLPDDVLLENVPISPRSLSQRRSAQSSPERSLRPVSRKEKPRPAGNGTPAVPAAQGSLRSPSSPAKPPIGHRGISMGQFPINHDGFRQPRAKSWTAALHDLSAEAKALTKKLEAHADEQQGVINGRRSTGSAPMEKRRVQSSMAELPPLRKTDIMIDPLPISKEKEAVLSRTRPSWLPPKNPQEEKKHIKQYQKMMALSLEAERKKEAEKRVRETCKDDVANSLLRIWEQHVLPNWDAVIPMKRTRELWWRGISPRSRGEVWQRAVGNELGLSDKSYFAALSRAVDLRKTIARGAANDDDKRRGYWLAKLEKDVATTFPDLKIFQQGAPLCNSLLDVASAYLLYRHDVGYVAGLNTIVALLLLNLPTPAAAFITLCNLLNRALPTAFLTHDPISTSKYLNLATTTLQGKLPRLSAHLNSPERSSIALDLKPDLYLGTAFTSLFTTGLDLESMTRLWDVWVFEGDAVLVRAAVALFSCAEARLYACDTMEDVQAVLRDALGLEGNPLGGDGAVTSRADEKWMRAVRDAGRGTRAATGGEKSPSLYP